MTNKIVVKMSDAKVATEQNDCLVTNSLGSCIGVCLYDAEVRIGGMLHFQLPESKMDYGLAASNPFKFADTGTDFLIKRMLSRGAEIKKMKVVIAGGASMDTGPKGFDIGKRNALALKKILWKKGLFLSAEDIGGNNYRNLYMYIDSGQVSVKSTDYTKILIPACKQQMAKCG